MSELPAADAAPSESSLSRDPAGRAGDVAAAPAASAPATAAPASPGPEANRATAADAASTSHQGRDLAAVRGFIERFTSELVQAGFPRTPARIFVALLTSDSSRLTAAELADLLQASPASVSGGVRYLRQVGLIGAEGEPGSRRQHYWMSEQVWQDIVRLRDRQFLRWAAELTEGIAVLGPGSPAGERMAGTVAYFEFIASEMTGLLARWDARAKGGEAPAGH